MEDINAVKERHEESLMEMAGVIGVAVGEDHGKPCILVLAMPGIADVESLPAELDGHPVVVELSGPIDAQV